MVFEETDIVLIPRERVGALVGQNGAARKQLEKATGVKIHVDGESGEVEIDRSKAKDPMLALVSLEIVKAIGRGFSPQKAFKLLLPEYYLEIIDLKHLVGDNPKTLARVRARVIGTEGKTRAYVSKLTSADLSVYGKTIAIIGTHEDTILAKNSLLKLVEGLPHKTVYRELEKKHKRRDEQL